MTGAQGRLQLTLCTVNTRRKEHRAGRLHFNGEGIFHPTITQLMLETVYVMKKFRLEDFFRMYAKETCRVILYTQLFHTQCVLRTHCVILLTFYSVCNSTHSFKTPCINFRFHNLVFGSIQHNLCKMCLKFTLLCQMVIFGT